MSSMSHRKVAVSIVFAIVAALGLFFRLIPAWNIDPDNLYDRALALVEAGKFEEARPLLARLRSERTPTPLDHGLQARVEIAGGNVDEALRELDAIPGDHALATWAKLRAGQLERSRYRFRLAEQHFREASMLDAALVEARRELIYVLGMQLRRQDMNLQFQVLSRQAPLSPKEVYVWCLVRDLAWWEASEQVPILEKAIAADASDDRSRVALAEILHRQSETEKALDVLARDPTKSLYVRAERLKILLDRDGPEAIEKPLAEIPADDPLTATMRGRLALIYGDAATAVRCFEVALKAEPGRRQTIADLGRAYAAAGDSEKAGRLTERAGKIDVLNNLLLKLETTAEGTGLEQWRTLAAACEAAGRLPEARAWHGLVLRQSPLDEQAQAAMYRIDRSPGNETDGL